MITRLSLLKITVATIALLCLVPPFAPAQPLDDREALLPKTGQSFFDQIHHQEVIDITLIANLDSLIHVKNTETYSPAELTFIDAHGVSRTFDIRVKPRGKFRRRVCDFPPIKLKISKEQLKSLGLSRHNDLKLVTHCLENDKYSENLVMREYLAYKLFNELTPNSFRVQLVRIHYIDRNNAVEEMTRYGFLIEDVDELAERIEGEECDDCYGIDSELIQNTQEKLSSLFQFMIGNTDWNMEMSRNLKMIKMADGSYLPVPYDFDYCVMVNAPYLRPNQDLQQSSNMERIFQGASKSIDEIYGIIAYFKTKEDVLMEVVRNFDKLGVEDRKQIENYLKSFFDRLESKSEAELMIFTRTG